MPELPEVVLCCRALEGWCKGRRLRQLEVLDPRVMQESLGAESLAGQSIRWVRRRGKLGILGFERHALVFHLRMTGQWLPSDSTQSRRIRAKLHMEGRTLFFDDARCLGHLQVLSLEELDAVIQARGLGPEPWPERRDGAWWKRRLQGLRGSIKPALMKQDRVAGLGNIAGSESCFWAGIDPRRPVPSLSDAEWEALANGVHHYIESTLDAEDGQELVYLALGGENPFQVYGRAGVCRRCGAEIIRLKQSGRGTWCCSSCQF